MSASRPGSRFAPDNRRRMSSCQRDIASGLAGSGDPVDRRGKRAPGGPLLVEDTAAGRRQRVEPAAPLTRALDPPALYPAAFLEAVQQWIEGRGAAGDGAVRELL